MASAFGPSHGSVSGSTSPHASISRCLDKPRAPHDIGQPRLGGKSDARDQGVARVVHNCETLRDGWRHRLKRTFYFLCPRSAEAGSPEGSLGRSSKKCSPTRPTMRAEGWGTRSPCSAVRRRLGTSVQVGGCLDTRTKPDFQCGSLALANGTQVASPYRVWRDTVGHLTTRDTRSSGGNGCT